MTYKPAKFYTQKEINELRGELIPKVGMVLDGHPSTVNIAILIEMTLMVAKDSDYDKQELIEIFTRAANRFYAIYDTKGETKQ
jgi:hypothetical protein